MDKIIEKWDEILNTVKQEYEISDVSFDTWIRPLEVSVSYTHLTLPTTSRV